MRPFEFYQPQTLKDALIHGNEDKARYFAGGTNLIDLMKEDVERPVKLISLTGVQSPEINMRHGQRLFLSAAATNTETANHPLVTRHVPLLSQAILSGASVQIRNMATNGGNLLQRTRCPYFYDVSLPCNKRVPGSGCGATQGFNRAHALFGWSESCVAVHPSDMAIALTALDAVVITERVKTDGRLIPMKDFHRLPGTQPQLDNILDKGELITGIEIAVPEQITPSHYLKVRDRSSYAFALVSAAAVLRLNHTGRISHCRLVMGGVAHKPWRLLEAEDHLLGKNPSEVLFREATRIAFRNARPLKDNHFKISLGQQTAERALILAMKKNKL